MLLSKQQMGHNVGRYADGPPIKSTRSASPCSQSTSELECHLHNDVWGETVADTPSRIQRTFTHKHAVGCKDGDIVVYDMIVRGPACVLPCSKAVKCALTFPVAGLL